MENDDIMSEDLYDKMLKLKNSLQNAKIQLQNAQNYLECSILFDNRVFKQQEFSSLKNKLDIQIENLSNKILPEIDNL